MKKFTIKGVLDGIRGSVSQQPKAEVEYIDETLRPEHFQVMKTVRHGFPHQPTALAFDPVQRILAIGTKTGSVRILGRPGVDSHVTHENDSAVIQLMFLVNEGALVSVCADDSLHLWNLRQKIPDVVHTLKFQKERITYCHLPFQSKWLYIGTEKGNIHIVNIESFVLSGYVINWNKAIELSRKTHPGPVVHLSDNPIDSNKLLIGFESGAVVLWDLKCKAAEYRFSHTEPLRSVAWHHDGKQFMCSHTDGSLTSWAIKIGGKPNSVLFPHAKTNKDGKPEACKPITKLEWKSQRGGEMFIVFAGGLPHDRAGRTPSLTVIHGKTTTVLEMEHNVVDFITLCESPWESDVQDPYAIVVLLHNDLVVVDLTTPGYLCFENPYPMDLHESPVTCCMYQANCPSDLVPAFYSVGSRNHKRSGFSEKAWPVSGGAWGTNTCSYPDIIITGHADGSLKFWDASAVLLQILYKLKTAKIFEKPKARSLDGHDDDPLAVQQIHLCPESRLLCVANASSHVILFRFSKVETLIEIPTLEIPIIYEVDDVVEYSPDYEYPPRPTIGGASQQGSYAGSSEENRKPSLETFIPIRVRSGPQKKAPGFQADLVCCTPWVEGAAPGQITSVSINSSYNLMAYGNESGLVIVDICQKTCLLNIGSPDLYGTSDPYQRIPRSPKKNQCDNNSGENVDRCRSPTSDQFHLPSVDQPLMDDTVSHVGTSAPLCGPPPASSEICGDADSLPVDETGTEATEETDAPRVPYSRRHHRVRKSLSVEPPPATEALPAEATRPRTATDPNAPRCLSVLVTSQQLDSGTRSETECGSNRSSTLTTPEPTSGSVSAPVLVHDVTAQQQQQTSPASDSEATATSGHSKAGELYKRNRSQSWRGFTFKKKKAAKKAASSSTDKASYATTIKSSKSITDLADGDSGDFRQRALSNVALVCQESEITANEARVLTRSKSVSAVRSKQKRDVTVADRWGGRPTFVDLGGVGVDDAGPLSPVVNAVRRLYVRAPPKEKIDSSFSRSRSSSMSSLENITSEAIQCLVFADSYTRKNDCVTCPTLWVGTSLGSVLVIILNLPPTGDLRQTQPVIVSPSGTIFRLKGAIQSMAFLDCNGALIQYQYDNWKDINKLEVKEKERERPRTPLRSPHNPTSRVSPTTSSEMGDRQFVVIVSEKQACVIALPSQTCAFKTQLADVSFVVKSDIITVRDSICLACYIANGHLATFSLPSLRPLMDIEFLPLIDLSYQTCEQGTVDPMISIWGKQLYHSCETDQIARTFCFSNFGHGMYLCSPCEIQKFTICVGFCVNLNEMLGDLFLPCETPEAPKESFIKSLFGGGQRSLDREELFGEASGKASRSIAKHIPGNINVENLNTKAVGVAGDVARAHRALTERGENLNRLEDRSERMMTEAERFSSNAHEIMMRQKDKKWYQF